MGDSLSAARDSELAEKRWRDNLSGAKKILHEEVVEGLDVIIDEQPFTKRQFEILNEARSLLMEVTGEQKYW